MNPSTVPFLDLRAQHDPLRADILAAISQVIDDSAFAGGPFVGHFETEFAAFCGARHAVGVSSGTEALWLTLLALGIGPGDEVITVPATFMATAEAISHCGAKPVFVDVDEHTYTMNPALLEDAITARTRAIIPVHLYGQMADMDAIVAIAERHGLSVIEDACQAHGAESKGRKAGTIGHAGCFSFYPGKNIGALGEAGAVVTNDAALAQEIAVLRDHGQTVKYEHSRIGWNGRMDGVQAAVLSLKLRKLAAGNAARREHALLYEELMTGLDGVALPYVAPDNVHVYHLYVLRLRNREQVRRLLAEHGVQCGIHYPVPLHLQSAYRYLGCGRGTFPVAEQLAAEALSLPMYPELTTAQIHYVVHELRNVLQETMALAWL